MDFLNDLVLSKYDKPPLAFSTVDGWDYLQAGTYNFWGLNDFDGIYSKIIISSDKSFVPIESENYSNS
jgi:hypothetical protein